MAILGFPSTAIIGNLDWTGTSSNLSASANFVAYGQSLVSIGTNGPNGSSYIAGDISGWQISTDDEACVLTVGTDGNGISLLSNGPASFVSEMSMSVQAASTLSIEATENLNLTGGNIISGGVNITSPKTIEGIC